MTRTRRKKLLAEAGYPNGFGVTLDCPNDRYVNDEAICQAVTAMLARIGVKVTLDAQTRLKYFAEISNPDYHTSFYMLGWTPSTYDAHNSLFNLLGHPQRHARRVQRRRLVEQGVRRVARQDRGRDRQDQAPGR